jgi:hypothetical protein
VVIEGKSLFFLGPKNGFRLLCHRILYSRGGEFFIFICILLSVMTFMMTRADRRTEEEKEMYDKVLDWIDFAFLVIFTVEMCTRIIVEGFFVGKHSYLRNPWNRLDFVVVVTGLIALFVHYFTARLRGFRAFRALRPLLSLRYMQGIHAILRSLGESLTLLVDVLTVMAFCFVVFGIMGIQLFVGVLRRRCVLPQTSSSGSGTEYLVSLPEPGIFCKRNPSSSWFGKSCPGDQTCDIHYGNPNFGFVSFDNIASAFLTIFVSTSLEGWTDFMYDVMER